ncbi:hypothetical protein [uncultured Christiangramia sp.]|uniref:hypothetical protein n=1 Tax=uncultured Christiangramia sp. TaxID=503836 RepID=UPI00262C6DE0|nr:hypothetical protein [uncultured Christiangramia sp.]
MRLITLLAIILLSTISYGQNNEGHIDESIDKSTKIYKELFLDQNFEELSNYASPELIQYLESKQDFVFLLTQLSQNAVNQGAKISDINFGNHSQIIKYENELQTVIPFTLNLENEKRLVEISSGIALTSTDNGENWYFTFQVIKDKAENNRMLGLDEKINIPSRTQNIIAK